MKRFGFLALVLSLVFLGSSPFPVNAAGSPEAVVYYNEACDECAHYINGELSAVLGARQVALVRKDYTLVLG